jgi:hypothetical protein
MEQLLLQFLGLAGVAAFIAALVNACKYFGVIADGSAPKISLALSVLGFVALAVLKLFAPDVNIDGLSELAQKAADVIAYVLGFFAMVGLPARAHQFLKSAGVPILGFYFSK